MTAKVIPLLAAAGMVCAATITPASADDTGFAYAHDMRGRCFSDHYHYGSGTGRNKPAAMKEAIVSWQSFTALEYGSDWARWGKAAGKAADCTKDSSGVSCSISARPCK